MLTVRVKLHLCTVLLFLLHHFVTVETSVRVKHLCWWCCTIMFDLLLSFLFCSSQSFCTRAFFKIYRLETFALIWSVNKCFREVTERNVSCWICRTRLQKTQNGSLCWKDSLVDVFIQYFYLFDCYPSTWVKLLREAKSFIAENEQRRPWFGAFALLYLLVMTKIFPWSPSRVLYKKIRCRKGINVSM